MNDIEEFVQNFFSLVRRLWPVWLGLLVVGFICFSFMVIIVLFALQQFGVI